MESIYNYTLDMLKNYMIDLGEKPFRSSQIIEWLYRFKIKSFDEMTNIKKDFIEVFVQLEIDCDYDLKCYIFDPKSISRFECVININVVKS